MSLSKTVDSCLFADTSVAAREHGTRGVGKVPFSHGRYLYEFKTNQEITKALEFHVRQQENMHEHFRREYFHTKSSEQDRKTAGVLCRVQKNIHAKFEEYLTANVTVLDL